MNQAAISPSSYSNCIKYDEIDLTQGCEVGCLYCGLAKSKEKVKELSIDSLIPEIKNINRGIYLSPNSDAFSPMAVEKTNDILKIALPLGKKILINTKCVIPEKTVDLLARYAKQCTVQVSVARLNQELTNFLEPHSEKIEDRLANISLMVQKGILVNALIMPMFPEVDDKIESLQNLVLKLSEAGIKCIKAAYVILKFGEDEKSLKMLRQLESNPLVLDSLRNMTEQIKAHIGQGNIAPIKTRLNTYQIIRKLCDKNGIKFLACSVLDPVLIEKDELPCRVCRSVLHYRN